MSRRWRDGYINCKNLPTLHINYLRITESLLKLDWPSFLPPTPSYLQLVPFHTPLSFYTALFTLRAFLQAKSLRLWLWLQSHPSRSRERELKPHHQSSLLLLRALFCLLQIPSNQSQSPIAHPTNGIELCTNVLVEDEIGERYLTAASQGFPDDNRVFHPSIKGTDIGQA